MFSKPSIPPKLISFTLHLSLRRKVSLVHFSLILNQCPCIEILRAAKILHQMEVAHSSQKGAFGLEMEGGGKEMIDAPMLKQASLSGFFLRQVSYSTLRLRISYGWPRQLVWRYLS